jgi:hypothetical protein
MKKSLATLATLACLAMPTTAAADGCWVNFNNPNYCSNELLYCTFDFQLDMALYGPQIADACYTIAVLAGERDSCVSDFNSLVFDYNGLVDQYNAKDALITKLKKKIRKLKKKIRR